ncbi:hypothetical protein BAC3_00998 [uncultured bacterium]|nr:hypothetical protein BAC3_00998 [uncultured bacterium]
MLFFDKGLECQMLLGEIKNTEIQLYKILKIQPELVFYCLKFNSRLDDMMQSFIV